MLWYARTNYLRYQCPLLCFLNLFEQYQVNMIMPFGKAFILIATTNREDLQPSALLSKQSGKKKWNKHLHKFSLFWFHLINYSSWIDEYSHLVWSHVSSTWWIEWCWWWQKPLTGWLRQLYLQKLQNSDHLTHRYLVWDLDGEQCLIQDLNTQASRWNHQIYD